MYEAQMLQPEDRKGSSRAVFLHTAATAHKVTNHSIIFCLLLLVLKTLQ